MSNPESRLRPTEDPLRHVPFDRARFERFLELTEFWNDWFEPRFEGLANLASVEGGMLVANHGLFGLELPCLLSGVYRATGRPLRGLGDRVLFQTPGVRDLATMLGGVEGHPAAAEALIREGNLCVVCPGGAREAFAPADEKYRLKWDGRVGFVRTTIRAGGALVPLAVIGSDDLYRQLVDGERMLETPLGRLVTSLFGAKYVPPLYLGLGFFPLPVRLEFLIGEPMRLDFPPEAADDERIVAEVHEAFRARLESLLEDGLRRREARIARERHEPRTRVERLALAFAG